MLAPVTRRAPRPVRRLIGLGLLCLPLCVGAHAATFNIADGDLAGLKTAITTANGTADVDIINLAPGGVYTLNASDNNYRSKGANGLPALTGSLILNGNGATIARSSAVGTPPFRVFFVDSGATVTFTSLTIAGGSSTAEGGGIYNDNGTVAVNSSILRGNGASLGGAIYNTGGALTVNNSTLSANSASTGGGGIRNVGAGTLTVRNSTLSANRALSSGGESFGGGIANNDAFLTVRNSTLSGNSADLGGGIYNSNTFRGAFTLSNTLLKTGASGENLYNDLGVVTSQGYNLSEDDGGGLLTGPGDQPGTAPLLDPNGLQNNGGLTPTIALLPGSPAIDKGRDIGATGQDQRGLRRPVDLPGVPNATGGDGSDIGAFEVQNEIPGDAAAPVISSVSVSPNTLSPPNNKLRDVTVNYSVADANDPNPACTLSVTSNDPAVGSDDIVIVDAHHLQLRASKAKGGKSPTRVYTIIITCTNAAGKTARATATVAVPKNGK